MSFHKCFFFTSFFSQCTITKLKYITKIIHYKYVLYRSSTQKELHSFTALQGAKPFIIFQKFKTNLSQKHQPPHKLLQMNAQHTATLNWEESWFEEISYTSLEHEREKGGGLAKRLRSCILLHRGGTPVPLVSNKKGALRRCEEKWELPSEEPTLLGHKPYSKAYPCPLPSCTQQP